MWTPSPRSPWLLAVVLAAAVPLSAPAQGWNEPQFQKVVKMCPKCGYKTDDLTQTKCPNCSGLGGGRAATPSTYTPPMGGGSGPVDSPFGPTSYGGSSATKEPEGKGLTLGDNIRIAVIVLVVGTLAIAAILGGTFLVVYLKNSVGKKAAKPARRSKRRRDWDDEDDD